MTKRELAQIESKLGYSLPECQSCGRCCAPHADVPTYVALRHSDARRLPANLLALDELGGALKTKTNYGRCVCVALVGRIDKRVRCAVYEDRPDVCRTYERGGEFCLEEFI